MDKNLLHNFESMFILCTVKFGKLQIFCFELYLTSSIKCMPSPHCSVFFSDLSWIWYFYCFTPSYTSIFLILAKNIPVVQKHYKATL